MRPKIVRGRIAKHGTTIILSMHLRSIAKFNLIFCQSYVCAISNFAISIWAKRWSEICEVYGCFSCRRCCINFRTNSSQRQTTSRLEISFVVCADLFDIQQYTSRPPKSSCQTLLTDRLDVSPLIQQPGGPKNVFCFYQAASRASHIRGLLLHMSHVPWSVGVSVSVMRTPVSPTKTTEPIMMPFTADSCGPRYRVPLDMAWCMAPREWRI